MNVTPEQKKAVKSQGFLANKDGRFSMRIITVNGVLTGTEMHVLSDIADKYGSGKVAFTSRLTVELPGIPYESIEEVKALVVAAGMKHGGTGSKVRPIVACKGTVCVFGNIDTQGLAAQVHKEFFEGWGKVVLPHKFKIGIGGCPNNCVKPDLNDLGIVGLNVPNYNAELCKSCKRCAPAEVCPMKAFQLENGKMAIGKDCNNCGMCVGKCPFKAIPDGNTKYKIYVGGRWGKKIRIGSQLSKLLSEEQVMDIIAKTILFYKESGISGERLSDTVERIGLSVVDQLLLGDDLLARREEILAIQTTGGAKC